MRIQRYIAKDMRKALAQVREALGPDAVILSSGRIGDDVEVVAAIDAEVARAVESAPPARDTRLRASRRVTSRARWSRPVAIRTGFDEESPRLIAAVRITGSSACRSARRCSRPAPAIAWPPRRGRKRWQAK